MPVAAIKGGLNQFQILLLGPATAANEYKTGNWTNQPLPNAKNGEGGQTNPLSYNVMPLPQDSTPQHPTPGYILKNFTYYETVKFRGDSHVAEPATAPNRGGTQLQVPTALFYDQQVLFAEGPGSGGVVHVENGAWLNLLTGQPLVGPYPPPNIPPKKGPGISLDDPSKSPSIAKQMSVPHGNSILALGSFSEPQDKPLVIADAPSVHPTPVHSGSPALDTTPYTAKLDNPDDYQNPQPDVTANSNLPIQRVLDLIKPNKFISWHVSTGNKGNTMNIPFEQRAANVTAYSASYWLLSNDGGASYKYLAYTQNISMQLTINGLPYNFPHVTSNVVTKVS